MPNKEAEFQEARSAFLAHRDDYQKKIAVTTDRSSRCALEIQYHREALPKYRQIFLAQVCADPSRRDELIRIFNADTGGERLWHTAKSKRQEDIRIGKIIKSLDAKPQRQSRKERQWRKKRQGKALMNHFRKH